MIDFKATILPNKVVVFGCGGTGSRLVPLLAQFIKTLPYVINPEIILFDFDNVEQKNLNRQNFVTQDIGKNKAVVLAARYSRAYDIPITPYPVDPYLVYNTRLTEQAQLPNLYNENVLYIMCVDSVAARQSILKYISAQRATSFILIDTGNGVDFGQVKLCGDRNLRTPGYSTIEKLKEMIASPNIPVSSTLNRLPFDEGYFENMVEPAEKASCADLDQTMAINALVATMAFSVIQNFYYAKPIPYHRINISLFSGCQPQYIDHQYLLDVSAGARYNDNDKSSIRGLFSTYRIDSMIEDDYEKFYSFKQMTEAAILQNKLKEEEKANGKNVAKVKAPSVVDEVIVMDCVVG